MTMAYNACVVMENAAGSSYDVMHGRWHCMYFFLADTLLPTFQHTIVNRQFYFQLCLLHRWHVRNPKNNTPSLNMQIKSKMWLFVKTRIVSMKDITKRICIRQYNTNFYSIPFMFKEGTINQTLFFQQHSCWGK